MAGVKKLVRPVMACFIIMTLLCGVIYPLLITGIAQVVFPSQANGSIITVTLKDGTKMSYGSALISQEFTKPEYLIGRPAVESNLSAVGPEEAQAVQTLVDWWHEFDPDNNALIPSDLVTGSGSGLDPRISPEAAQYQVVRIAKARGISENSVNAIISKYTTGKLLGIWGESAVNVLKVNLALDGLI